MRLYRSPAGPAVPRLADPLFVAFGSVVLLLGCVLRSYQMPMWLDEMLSFNLIQDPSTSHMLTALGDQADGSSPLYYLLIRPWAAVFSLHEVSLRLFSAAAFCAAFVLLWWTLRRAYGFLPTALVLSLVIGTSPTVYIESFNVRVYGLLYALICLGALLAVELGVRARPGRALLAGNCLTQALLVLCHPLGGFYSAFLLLATVAADAWSYRRLRWVVASSYPAGWLALGLWGRQLLRQAEINAPHGWIPVPSLKDLWPVNGAAGGDLRWLGLFLVVGCVGRVLAGRWAQAGPAAGVAPASDPPEDAGTAARRRRLWFVGGALLGMLPFLWLFSQLAPNNSLFIARYLIGVNAGWAILLTPLCTAALVRPAAPRLYARRLLPAACAGFILLNFSNLFAGENPSRLVLPGYADVSYGHANLPVVCQHAAEFLPRAHYSSHAGRYYFLLDWAAASSPANPYPGAVTEYKLLRGIARHYGELYRHHIMEAEDFLRAHPAFLIQNVPQNFWITHRLDPAEYTVTPLTPTGPLMDIAQSTCPLLLVERRK